MVSTLANHKYVFGKPRSGFHALRIPILDWAFVDTVLTMWAAYLTYQHQWGVQGFYFVHLSVWLILGACCHRLFELA